MMAPALLLALALGAAADEGAWPVDQTAHFVVHHESPGAALGDYNRLDQLFEGLHRSLWSLVPWMAAEKTHVYLYADPKSYRAGRFSPPAWSAGLLSLSGGEKAVALVSPLDSTTAAHELTHLYLHAFFAEKDAQPPAWLDEGLASMLQSEALAPPDPRAKGPVLKNPMPLAKLFAARPAADSPSAWVGAWYRQSESVVWFLQRGHVQASFPGFCGALRDGEDLEGALRDGYGYPDLAAFERAWRAWRPRHEPGQLQAPGD